MWFGRLGALKVETTARRRGRERSVLPEPRPALVQGELDGSSLASRMRHHRCARITRDF